jgi:hypothetical protein
MSSPKRPAVARQSKVKEQPAIGIVREAFRVTEDLPPADPFLISGTAASGDPGGNRISDVAMTNLLGIHMTAINAGKVLIWQRYNVMLTANAILLGLVARSETESSFVVAMVHGVGVALCCAWFVISIGGWAYSTKRLRIVSRFKWVTLGDDANPGSKVFAPVVDTGLGRDHIFLAALAIIGLFLLAHTSLFVRVLLKLLG